MRVVVSGPAPVEVGAGGGEGSEGGATSTPGGAGTPVEASRWGAPGKMRVEWEDDVGAAAARVV